MFRNVYGSRWAGISVLIAEDFPGFRQFLSATLRQRSSIQEIHEVSDGLEAVRKAAQLQPHLVLLDIGLPTINGIEVARKIRELSPQSKIVFVTSLSSAEIAREALTTGAQGIVLKLDASSELLSAVAAVMRGEQFVSRSFLAHAGVSDAPILHADQDRLFSQVLKPSNRNDAHCHEIHFYSDDDEFVEGMASVIGTDLQSGATVIFLALRAHRERVFSRLAAYPAFDVAVAEGRYQPLDADEVIDSFMVDGELNRDRFMQVANSALSQATSASKANGRRVVGCGQCAPLLWLRGHKEAAIQIEQMWNEVSKEFPFDILCSYPFASIKNLEDSRALQQICAEHSAIHY
jgi:DNA-binding NarL/FixJ family response regulator